MNLDYTVLIDIIGTVAFALSGFIVAAKERLDILGILVVSYVTAFGGGVIRDLLVDRPPFIFSETYPITVVFITILIAFIFKLHNRTKLTNNYIFYLSDSMGLSLFAYTGATIGLEYNFNFGGVVFLSFLTAVGGGIIRDIILNKIPFILTNDFYGTIAIVVGILVWTLSQYSLINPFSTISVLVLGVIMRLLAIRFQWKLPKLVNK